MTGRGVFWFVVSFSVVVALGLLTGCSSDDFHNSRISKGHAFVSYCGMSRCDGKENR